MFHPTAKPWLTLGNAHPHPQPTRTTHTAPGPTINRLPNHGGSPPQRPADRLAETFFAPDSAGDGWATPRRRALPFDHNPYPCFIPRQSRGLTPATHTHTRPTHTDNAHRPRAPPSVACSATPVRPHNAPPWVGRNIVLLRLRRGSNHHGPPRAVTPSLFGERTRIARIPSPCPAKPWANTDISTPSPALTPMDTVTCPISTACPTTAVRPQRPAARIWPKHCSTPRLRGGSKSPRGHHVPSRLPLPFDRRIRIWFHPTAPPSGLYFATHTHTRNPHGRCTIVPGPRHEPLRQHGNSPPQRPALRFSWKHCLAPAPPGGGNQPTGPPRAVTPLARSSTNPSIRISSHGKAVANTDIPRTSSPAPTSTVGHSSPAPPSTACPTMAVPPHNAPPIGWSNIRFCRGEVTQPAPPRAVTPFSFDRRTRIRVSSHGKAVG